MRNSVQARIRLAALSPGKHTKLGNLVRKEMSESIPHKSKKLDSVSRVLLVFTDSCV
jgi:hypothetical protein